MLRFYHTQHPLQTPLETTSQEFHSFIQHFFKVFFPPRSTEVTQLDGGENLSCNELPEIFDPGN